jgi:hypothetical protein
MRMGVVMLSICDVRGCGAPATKTLAYALTVQGMRVPAMTDVCDVHGEAAKSAGRWHTAKGESPAIKLSGFGSKNSTFLSLGPLVDSTDS